MDGLFGIIWIIILAVFASKMKGKRGKRSSSSAGSQDQYAARQAQVRQKPSISLNYKRPEGALKVESAAGQTMDALRNIRRHMGEADTDAYEESLDYCSSDVPASEGISFKDLPEGVDELEVLIKANRRREKLLEKSMIKS